MASRGMSLNPLTVLQVAAASGGRWHKMNTCNAQDGIQHCLHSTCYGVEMFTTLPRQVLILATSYAAMDKINRTD